MQANHMTIIFDFLGYIQTHLVDKESCADILPFQGICNFYYPASAIIKGQIGCFVSTFCKFAGTMQRFFCRRRRGWGATARVVTAAGRLGWWRRRSWLFSRRWRFWRPSWATGQPYAERQDNQEYQQEQVWHSFGGFAAFSPSNQGEQGQRANQGAGRVEIPRNIRIGAVWINLACQEAAGCGVPSIRLRQSG